MADEKWIGGVPQYGGFSRYGPSPYYKSPEGWSILVDADWAGSYEFEMLVIWRNDTTGALKGAVDSGCSCPTPFSDLTMDDARTINNMEDLQKLYEAEGKHGGRILYAAPKWDEPDDKLTEVISRVHRALTVDQYK